MWMYLLLVGVVVCLVVCFDVRTAAERIGVLVFFGRDIEA